MRQPRIVIVDSAGPQGLAYGRLVARLQPLEVRHTSRVAEGIDISYEDGFDLAILVLRIGDSDLTTLDQLVEADPDLPIVVIGSDDGEKTVSDYLRHGAATYLPLESVDHDLEEILIETLTQSRQRATEQTLRRAIERPYSFEDFLGESPPMKAVYSLIERIATRSVDILITGETGTGKELVARAVHRRSRRAAAPFVPIDCGAIPDTLLESELFGHERGAFTGADTRRIGLIEVADGGTLFLDEIAELPLALQVKLLRVLQERRLRRVGARKETPVDVRIVAATSRDIDGMLENGTFRRDLFYRINVVRISLPPLRQRGDDIGLLAEFFASRAGREMGLKAGRFSADTYQVLRHYSWPGNVRELQNVIRRAMALTADDVIGVDDLPDNVVTVAGKHMPDTSNELKQSSPSSGGFFALKATHVAEFEQHYLYEIMKRLHGDVSAAAKEAHVPRGTLYRLLKSHNIEPSRFRHDSSNTESD
ncbi:sigma-54 dependent transcriptional regulator [Pirellulales bacterium]|nr:sigma-54 dependent transcriptional regulator [Pirellulales bacterium]